MFIMWLYQLTKADWEQGLFERCTQKGDTKNYYKASIKLVLQELEVQKPRS